MQVQDQSFRSLEYFELRLKARSCDWLTTWPDRCRFTSPPPRGKCNGVWMPRSKERRGSKVEKVLRGGNGGAFRESSTVWGDHIHSCLCASVSVRYGWLLTAVTFDTGLNYPWLTKRNDWEFWKTGILINEYSKILCKLFMVITGQQYSKTLWELEQKNVTWHWV